MIMKKNYCRYFKCADITIKIESDLPITEETFHPTFYPFQIDKPEESMINIQYHFEMPYLDSNDLGKPVYYRENCTQKGCEAYRKGDSWVYLTDFKKHSNVANKIAIFNKDHTKGRIYSNKAVTNDEMTKLEDNSSTYLFDIVLTHISLANVLADRDGIFLHSSGIVIGGKGILFVGHSGAGKTTLRNMALLREDIKPLCNDKHIVRKCSDGYRVYGTWVFSDNLSDIQAISVPLKAIMFLEQALENKILPLEENLKLGKMLAHVIRPIESKEWWDKTLSIVGEITREVPCYRVRFDLTGRIIDQLEHITPGDIYE